MNDFPKEEFANRISKIQENLEKESIQAVIITSPSNFRYFSKSQHHIGIMFGSGPWWFYLPKFYVFSVILSVNET